MTVPRIVVHADVVLQHLGGARSPSVLRQAMGKFFCYVTVFDAIRLFSLAKSERERKAIEDSMATMKIMGLNPKRARMYGRLLASSRPAKTLNVLVAGLCLESMLPILTDRAEDFGGIRGLLVVPTMLVPEFESGQEILRAARRHVHSFAREKRSL